MRMLRIRLVPILVLLLLMSPALPLADFSQLSEEATVLQVPANLEGYDLYLDEPGDSGGEGAITTMEPAGAHKEASVLSGVEFRSTDMISDLTVFGEGSNSLIRLSIYMQFKGSEGSTADITFTLNSVGGPTYTETKSLDDPCNSGLFNSDCSWTVNEVFFDVPADGFVVAKGAQLRLQIDGSASCEGQSGGIGQSGECEVSVAYGDVEQTDGFSRLELKANALADSSVKVHATGSMWVDEEQLEWSPNHRPDFRTIQFSVDVRDAFGRDDIQSVSLILTTPSGTNTVFDKEFEEDDLRLDNNGLVGNYTWTYEAGIAAGHYTLQLQITDVQAHTVLYNHQGIDFMEHGVYLSLPVDQPDVVLIAPGQVTSVEFMVEHTGAAGIEMNVVFELFTSLPSTWSDPIWDQPAGYTLESGGSFARPILSIEAPDSDLSTAPERIEVWARAYAENDEGISAEVAIEKIVLDVEEVGVFAPPRMGVFEDADHQRQIADSTRLEAYDPAISHYIDSESVGEFYIDLFNAGFDNDNYRLKVEDIPDGWQYVFYNNETGAELTTEGIHAITPEVSSHGILSLVVKIYPPSSRDDLDIGLVTIRCASTGDSALNSVISFTVHRTFGILAQVLQDSDGQEIGRVVADPGDTVSYSIRVTDSTDSTSQNTWRVKSPGTLDKNTDVNPAYGTWDYSIVDDNDSAVVALRLSSGQSSDIVITIEMRDQVTAGNHTLFLRVTEENVEENARYFDLPLIIEINEDVRAGRLNVERLTALSAFLPNQAQDVEFRIENENNVPLDVVITASDIPAGWAAKLSTTSSSSGRDFVILEIGAFSTKEFTMSMVAPDDIVAGKDVKVQFEITPMDDEEPYAEKYTQRPIFLFSTSCEGAPCLINAAMDFQNPQTQALYVGILLVGGLALYRRGKSSGSSEKGWNEDDYGVDEDDVEMELEEIPEPIMSDQDLDDDLELLDELEDL